MFLYSLAVLHRDASRRSTRKEQGERLAKMAQDFVSMSLQLNPHNAEAHTVRCELHLMLEQYSDALDVSTVLLGDCTHQWPLLPTGADNTMGVTLRRPASLLS